MSTKHQNLIVYIWIVTWLMGCKPVDLPQVPTVTNTSTPPPTANVTVLPLPTLTITPTYSSPTPIPTLQWAGGILPITLGNTVGHWSPVDNSLLLTNCGEFPRSADAIALAEAPEFEPRMLNDTDFSCDDNPNDSVEWSPDGTQILFVGSDGDPVSRLHPTIWIMEHDGSSAHPLDAAVAMWWPRFLGWMNHSTFVVDSYTGGGSHEVVLWNINTGERLARSVIWGGWFEPNATYVVGTICMPTCFLTAMSKTVQDVPVDWYPAGSEYGILPEWDTGGYDEQTDYAKGFSIQQWVDNTNQVLYSAEYWKGDGLAWGTWLGIWDIDAQHINMLVPDGFYGRMSSNAQYLMYLTVGQQKVDSQQRPLDNDLESIASDASIYVQIYDIAGSTIILSEAVPRRETENPNGQDGGNFAFSPNSQYGAIVVEDGASSLKLLELQTREVAFEFSSSTWKPVWSPDSQQIVFRDQSGNLSVLRLLDGTITQITRNAGDRRMAIMWAQDSKTLAVIWAEGDFGDQELAVINLP